MSAIKNWKRQHVQDCQVNVHQHAEPEGQSPPLLVLKQEVIDAEYLDRSAEVLRFYVRLSGEQRTKGADHRADTCADLLDGAGVSQSRFSTMQPKNSQPWFFVGWRERHFRLHCYFKRLFLPEPFQREFLGPTFLNVV